MKTPVIIFVLGEFPEFSAFGIHHSPTQANASLIFFPKQLIWRHPIHQIYKPRNLEKPIQKNIGFVLMIIDILQHLWPKNKAKGLLAQTVFS